MYTPDCLKAFLVLKQRFTIPLDLPATTRIMAGMVPVTAQIMVGITARTMVATTVGIMVAITVEITAGVITEEMDVGIEMARIANTMTESVGIDLGSRVNKLEESKRLKHLCS